MSRGRVKIPVHVFAFTSACIPGIFYAMYWKRNHETDEEFEEKLREKYGTKIQSSKDKRENMVKLIQAMKQPGQDTEQDEKFHDILKGGKTSIKRHYAVDESLYGTEAGVVQRKKAEEDVERKMEQKKMMRKKKKKKASVESSSDIDMKKKGSDDDTQSKKTNEIGMTKSAFALTAVGGGLAVLATTLLNGKRSQ